MQKGPSALSTAIQGSLLIRMNLRFQVPRDNLHSVFKQNGVMKSLADRILKALDRVCDPLGSRIAMKVDALRKDARQKKASASKTTKSPSSSPTKTTKSSPPKTTKSASSSPSKPAKSSSPSKNPYKSLRWTTILNSSPAQTSLQKRKAASVESQPDGEESLVSSNSPSQKQRLDTMDVSNDEEIPATPNWAGKKRTLDALSTIASGSSDENMPADLFQQSPLKTTPSSPSASSESPSKKRRLDNSSMTTSVSSDDGELSDCTSQHTRSTMPSPSTSDTLPRITTSPYRLRQAVFDESDEEMDDDDEPEERFRPVFLDHQQWYQRDPRIAQEWEEAEKQKQKWDKLYGHPFEKYQSKCCEPGLE
jgi:hypothetical protein